MDNLNRALTQLRSGLPIIIYDSDDRESEGDFAFSAKFCTPQLVNLCLTYGKGLICVSLEPHDAVRLKIERLHTNNKDIFSTPFGMPINLADESSGISASARSATIVALSNPTKKADDFSYPGHVHTLIANPGGLKKRQGHTEAILDVLRMADIDGPGVLCEILRPDGEIAKFEDLKRLGKELNIPMLTIESIISAQDKKAYATT